MKRLHYSQLDQPRRSAEQDTGAKIILAFCGTRARELVL